jgi:hypothetical protein
MKLQASELKQNNTYSNNGIILTVKEIKTNKYGELCAYMTDGSYYSYVYDFKIFEVYEAPIETIKEKTILIIKKEKDSLYYKTKERHLLLSNKKLEHHKKGTNTTMKNAYITQELESLREILREY